MRTRKEIEEARDLLRTETTSPELWDTRRDALLLDGYLADTLDWVLGDERGIEAFGNYIAGIRKLRKEKGT